MSKRVAEVLVETLQAAGVKLWNHRRHRQSPLLPHFTQLYLSWRPVGDQILGLAADV